MKSDSCFTNLWLINIVFTAINHMKYWDPFISDRFNCSLFFSDQKVGIFIFLLFLKCVYD